MQCGSVGRRNSVRQCEQQLMWQSHSGVCALHVIVCGSVLGSVWQWARQCAAVRQCGNVWQCACLLSVCGSVRQYGRQCAAVCMVVSGSVRGNVRLCTKHTHTQSRSQYV
jgi:hypothetical protein